MLIIDIYVRQIMQFLLDGYIFGKPICGNYRNCFLNERIDVLRFKIECVRAGIIKKLVDDGIEPVYFFYNYIKKLLLFFSYRFCF